MKNNFLKVGFVLAMLSIVGAVYPQQITTNGTAVTMAIRDVDMLLVLNTMFASTNDVYRVKYEESAAPFLAGRVSRMDVKGMPFDLTLRKIFDDSSVPLDFTKAPGSNGSTIYSIFAKAGATYTIPTPPPGMDPLNQPPRQNNNGTAAQPKRNPLQPDPPVAFDLQPYNDVPVVGPATGPVGPVGIGDPAGPGDLADPVIVDPNTGTPGTDTGGGDTTGEPDNGFMPEPEKKSNTGSTSITKPASSEYFVRVIPVTKMNLASLALSLGVRTSNVNDSRSGTKKSTDWWAGSSGSSSTPLSTGTTPILGSTGYSPTGYNQTGYNQTGVSPMLGTGSSYGFGATGAQTDLTRLSSLYQAVDYDYQMLLTQAFSLNMSKNPGIASAIRSLQNKHDRIATDVQDQWRISDNKGISQMQIRLMSLQSDIDNIRAMDTSLVNPMTQQMNMNQTPQYDSDGNLITPKTGSNINTQLQTVQTAYTQAVTQFANNSRYRTQLNKVKTYINAAQNSIINNAGKKVTNTQAAASLQTAADILIALGVSVDMGITQNTTNPMLAALNPALSQQNGYNNGYNQNGYNNGYNQNGYNNGYNNRYNQNGYNNGYNNNNNGYNNGYNNNNNGYNNGYNNGGTNNNFQTQFSQLETQYNTLRSNANGTTMTSAQTSALNSILTDVNNLRNLVNNQNYVNNQNNYNSLTNSMNNLTTKINNYQNNYPGNGTGTTTDTTTIQTDLTTANTDLQGIDDAIRNFNVAQFPKITSIQSSETTIRNSINQIQTDLMNNNPNISSIQTRLNSQVKSRIVAVKQDVYRVQQDVINALRNQINTLRTLVSNSVDAVKNQYSGEVDTHNSDFNDIQTDFNNSTYIRDPANQNDWATRVTTLMSAIEATRTNVQNAINNNK